MSFWDLGVASTRRFSHVRSEEHVGCPGQSAVRRPCGGALSKLHNVYGNPANFHSTWGMRYQYGDISVICIHSGVSSVAICLSLWDKLETNCGPVCLQNLVRVQQDLKISAVDLYLASEGQWSPVLHLLSIRIATIFCLCGRLWSSISHQRCNPMFEPRMYPYQVWSCSTHED